jgi:type IV secretory pathway TrbL component
VIAAALRQAATANGATPGRSRAQMHGAAERFASRGSLPSASAHGRVSTGPGAEADGGVAVDAASGQIERGVPITACPCGP